MTKLPDDQFEWRVRFVDRHRIHVELVKTHWMHSGMYPRKQVSIVRSLHASVLRAQTGVNFVEKIFVHSTYKMTSQLDVEEAVTEIERHFRIERPQILFVQLGGSEALPDGCGSITQEAFQTGYSGIFTGQQASVYYNDPRHRTGRS